MITYILVADRAEAKIYRRSSLAKPLELVKALTNPLGKAQKQEINTDRPGVVKGKFGGFPAPYTNEQDTKDRILENFMHTVSADLTHENDEGEFDFLIIAAEPKVLGTIRQLLPERVSRRVIGSFDKELTRINERELKTYFDEVKPPVASP